MGSRSGKKVARRRSRAYRDRFLKACPGPVWRCRYCGRRLSVSELTVDHIVPVSALLAGDARALAALSWLGASGIDDLPNLAPACARCNSSKGAKMGRWLFVGAMGRHRWFRPVWVAFHVVLAAAVGVMVLTALACVIRASGVRLPMFM